MMKVVPSSYHQLLQSPTLSETADIRGNQAMSWGIAIIAQKKSVWMAKNTRVASNQSHPLEKKIKIDCRSIAITKQRGPKDRFLR